MRSEPGAGTCQGRKPDLVRVAFVLPSFAGGGAERVMLSVLAGLDRTRFAPALVALDGSGPLRDAMPADCPLTVLDRPRLRGALPALLGTLRRLEPQVVMSTMAYLNLGVLALKPRLPGGTHVVVREANMPLAGLAGTRRALVRLGYRLLYPRADAVLAPAQTVADALAHRHPGLAARLRVIPNPVDEAAIRAAADNPVRAPGAGLRIVAAGRLTRQKGFDRLVALLPDLPDNTHLTILGDGPERSALLDQAGSRGLDERVLLTGHLAAPWAHFAGADVLALPSRWEGLPNVALEALACGTPAVAAPEAGGIAEIAALTPDSVSIRALGPDFAAALGAMPANRPASLRPSLLPESYRRDAVVARYAVLLTSLAEGARR